MADILIDKSYIRSFFGIEDSPEGEDELEEIMSKLERVEYIHGQDIVVIDDEPDGMYFLESGTAMVIDREGQQVNILHEGQYFGEYAVLARKRRLTTVRSHGKTVVYRLGTDDMMDILIRHPDTYGEFMKRVYSQVEHKHKELLMLSRMRRGILQHPQNQTPLTPMKMILRYGILAQFFFLSLIFIPTGTAAPVFLLPLVLMVVYVLITRQTVESLIVAGLYAAMLYMRSGLSVSYTESLLNTIGDTNNVFTVFVMALLGAFVSLIEASGAVTAFKKRVDKNVKSARGVKLTILFITLVTGIDDFLNHTCASTSTNASSEKNRVSCEERSLMLSFLPTVMCSFIPISLWSIFVIGSITPSMSRTGFAVFVRSIPFNFFSIVVVLAMLLFCFGKLPLIGRLKEARRRVENGGKLWPSGSERFLLQEEPEVWGRLWNIMLPVVFLAASSLTLRSLFDHSFAVDSACGLVATLIFMFLLYCAQGLMSPEQFTEYMISGIQSMALPIILYLLTMCFSTLLNQQAMSAYLNDTVAFLKPVAPLLPAALFLISTLLTVALGSSWAMYAIAFPIAVHIAGAVGINVPLCIGAVCAAGIAGEKNCLFSSDSTSVGEAIGCDPSVVLSIRLTYSIIFTLITLLLYIAAGFLLR